LQEKDMQISSNILKIGEVTNNPKDKQSQNQSLTTSSKSSEPVLEEKLNKVNKNTIVLKHDPQVFQHKDHPSIVEPQQKGGFKLTHKLDKLEELAPQKKIKLDAVNFKVLSPKQEIEN